MLLCDFKKAGAITKGAVYGAGAGGASKLAETALRVGFAKNKGKALKESLKGTGKRILKGTAVGTAGGAALKGYKHAKGFGKGEYFHFSPVLSTFARTEGAKDKKPRKKRGLGKKLAIGAGLGVLGLAGARYGIPALKGGALGIKQLKRYKAPIRKNLKYVGDAAKGGFVEQVGQDKALLQELAEKIKNRNVDPFDTKPKKKFNLEKTIRHKLIDILPNEVVRKLEKGSLGLAYRAGELKGKLSRR